MHSPVWIFGLTAIHLDVCFLNLDWFNIIKYCSFRCVSHFKMCLFVFIDFIEQYELKYINYNNSTLQFS